MAGPAATRGSALASPAQSIEARRSADGFQDRNYCRVYQASVFLAFRELSGLEMGARLA